MMFLKLKLKRLRRESTPDAAFKAALRARLLASQQPLIVHRFASPMMRYAFATSALVLVFVFGTTTFAYASSSVGAGDTLYPIKSTIEEIEASMKKTPEAQARFQARMLDRRAREIAYRLRHDEPLRLRDVAALAKVMDLSIDEFRDLANDEGGRDLIKTEVKANLIASLTEFRAQIELTDDLTDEQKQLYYDAIDRRLEFLNAISTTAPLE